MGDIYVKDYQEKLIRLKVNLYNSSDKISSQSEIMDYLNNFLSNNFDQIKFDDIHKTLYYKVYTLFVVLFFIEINKFFLFKKNVNFQNINEIFLKFNLEKQLENIIIINDIIWDLLDICSNNILFYNYLKLKIIKIFLENINFEYLSINFGIKNVDIKFMDYKEKIKKLNNTILEYEDKLNMIEGDENIINEKNCSLEILEILKKGLKVKEFIIKFNLSELSEQNEENFQSVQEYIINYFNYGLDLTSPEYLQLKQIYKTLEIDMNVAAPTITNKKEYEIKKYINLYNECINGKYHGKEIYYKDIDEIENEEDEDEDEDDDKDERILDIYLLKNKN